VKEIIRKFKSTDRERVRDIATSTVTGYPRSDLQLVADLLTEYYVTYEPEHTLIAEVDDEVVGYLSGCINSPRCRWIKGTRVIPKAIIKALVRGEVGWSEVRYLGSFIYVAAHGGLRSSPPAGYPAHFHVNVRENYRGLGLGTTLVERFFKVLRENGIPGVHVRLRRGDIKAVEFFKSFGFTRSAGYPIAVSGENGMGVSWSVIYVKKL